MKKVLLGVLLILLGGMIRTENYIIELTPNFIGSLLLLLALIEFKIKDRKLIWSLWILTGIYLFNYIVLIVNPNGIPIQLQPILIGGSLLWGIFIAVKIVEKVRIDHEEGYERNLKLIRKWFKVLFVVSVVIAVGITGIVSTKGVINLISVWVYSLGTFVGVIARYILVYLFYKESKFTKPTS